MTLAAIGFCVYSSKQRGVKPGEIPIGTEHGTDVRFLNGYYCSVGLALSCGYLFVKTKKVDA